MPHFEVQVPGASLNTCVFLRYCLLSVRSRLPSKVFPMTLQQASSLPRNKGVEKQNLCQSQRRLQNVTKAAVDKACKMHVESRRLVHIVDTQSCGSSSGLGLSNPFSSLSSLTRRPPSSSPSNPRQWSLSRGSTDRRTVAARIHSLLIQWKADPSLEWRAKVASAVPVLEEVLYKGAKSKEEYTNPHLLESQLMHVLYQFEAGNGPFLLQGCTPPISMRASSSSSAPSVSMSPLHQDTLGHGLTIGKGFFELASEQRCNRARVSCLESTASSLCPMVRHNDQEIVSLNEVDSKAESPDSHVSNKFVSKVANMLTKMRRDNNTKSKHELGRACSGLDRAEDFECGVNVSNGTRAASLQNHSSPCSRDEDRSRTLGGILWLNRVNESKEQRLPCMVAEEASLAASRADQDIRSVGTPPFLVSDDESGNTSGITNLSPEAVATIEPSIKEEHVVHVEQISIHSASSSLSSSSAPFASSSLSVSSSSSSNSTITPRISTSSVPSTSLHGLGLSPPLSPRWLPLTSPSASCASSSSTIQQPQGSECQHQKLVTLFTASNERSQRCINSESNNHVPKYSHFQSSLPLTTGSRPQVELHQSTTQPASQTGTEEESRGSSLSSLRSSCNEMPSKSRDKGLKLPLGRFLAERDDYKGYVSKYLDGGYPWETWEEATEQLDGMCCVCMVGLKGAAFIPCGHTFCRKCSRELWRGRGTCPLCNRYIREILDIY